ncbi:hypothetical protein EJ419_01545 [Alloscardovia theropitheci]|uniref:Uncharacterized protein n=1 Tax=Alloscardovia theropitheci TaxID=2496842 RepID=A0A4V2MU30_9BIFI|nr:hypothetical protein [Alloscardovia theropitheci]TCD54809.1 hypothetical protein EJ419_01545 [Alloscardovia theropitheci]
MIDNSELTFDTYYHIGTKKENIKFHIAQCVNGDIDKQTCIKLAYSSCNMACLAIDVVRGRLGFNMLNSLAHPKVISRLNSLSVLLCEENGSSQIVWADRACKHLPIIIRTFNGFAVSPVRFNANVGLMLAGKPCWAYVVFRFNGRKWVCTSCDFW